MNAFLAPSCATAAFTYVGSLKDNAQPCGPDTWVFQFVGKRMGRHALAHELDHPCVWSTRLLETVRSLDQLTVCHATDVFDHPQPAQVSSAFLEQFLHIDATAITKLRQAVSTASATHVRQGSSNLLPEGPRSPNLQPHTGLIQIVSGLLCN